MQDTDPVAKLKGELRQRDERIKELIAERDRETALAQELRERLEENRAVLESWIESFSMELDDRGNWDWHPFVARFEARELAYNELLKKWNRFVPRYNAIVAPRSPGRPLAASPSQQRDVLKRRKAGQSLRAIADETALGLQTVRTIIDQADGVDRAALARLKRIAPDRLADAHERAARKQRAALPQRINAALNTSAALCKKAKA
jgi:hypothetical protein